MLLPDTPAKWIDFIKGFPTSHDCKQLLLADIASLSPELLTVHHFKLMLESVDWSAYLTTLDAWQKRVKQSDFINEFKNVTACLDDWGIEPESAMKQYHRQQWQQLAAQAWFQLAFPDCDLNDDHIALNFRNIPIRLSGMLSLLGEYFHKKKVTVILTELQGSDNLRFLLQWYCRGVRPSEFVFNVQSRIDALEAASIMHMLTLLKPTPSVFNYTLADHTVHSWSCYGPSEVAEQEVKLDSGGVTFADHSSDTCRVSDISKTAFVWSASRSQLQNDRVDLHWIRHVGLMFFYQVLAASPERESLWLVGNNQQQIAITDELILFVRHLRVKKLYFHNALIANQSKKQVECLIEAIADNEWIKQCILSDPSYWEWAIREDISHTFLFSNRFLFQHPRLMHVMSETKRAVLTLRGLFKSSQCGDFVQAMKLATRNPFIKVIELSQLPLDDFSSQSSEAALLIRHAKCLRVLPVQRAEHEITGQLKLEQSGETAKSKRSFRL